MAKNRTIPFGYCMKNGEIQVNTKESRIIEEIFNLYLDGNSLIAIADQMSRKGASYNGVNNVWNKNMIKRIIENEKYLGTEKYPKIISEKFFNQANEKRKSKATSVYTIPEDLQTLRKLTYCAECGHKLSRIGGNSKYERWDCRNPDCCKLEYRLTDQMIIGAVLTVLNTAIANPELLSSDAEISSYTPSIDVTCLQNEIRRMIDSTHFDFERIKSEIFRLAQMKYDCCTYNDKQLKTEHLTNILDNKQQLNKLDIDLLKSCVSRILVSHFYTIEVEFINGVTINNITERKEKNDNSAECNDNSCQSSDIG